MLKCCSSNEWGTEYAIELLIPAAKSTKDEESKKTSNRAAICAAQDEKQHPP